MSNYKSQMLMDCLNDLSQDESFVDMRKYMQHGKTDCLLHSIAVAYYSYTVVKFFNLKLNQKSLIRGALLHDFFLYDWHEPDCSHKLHGFTHPKTALRNARRNWELDETEIDIIMKHMFPLIPALPRCKESALVCIMDKICSVSETLFLPYCREVRILYCYAQIKCINRC